MERVADITSHKKCEGVITFRKIAGITLLFLLIITTGFWLSSVGRPLNSGIFTAHKLISVVAIIVLFMTIYRIHKASGLSTSELTGVIITGVLFLGTVVTGGFLSLDWSMPVIIFRMHQALPFVTTLSTGVTLFLLK